MVDNKQDLPNWDLSDLYANYDDPRLEEDLHKGAELANAFSDRYRGRIESDKLTAEMLAAAMEDYIALNELLYKPESYASLLFSADTSKAEHGALMQKVQERISTISTGLIFFDLELGRISQEKWDELKDDPRLAEFRHYIEQERLLHKYSLSEAEETILEETANCSGRAFVRLFTETVTRLKYPMFIKGEPKELTQSELLALFYDPDREVRRQASKVLSQVLTANIHPIHFAYSTLILEKLTHDRLRGFEYPEQARHLSNELPAEAIETMINVVVKNYPLVSRYYELKSKLLDITPLYHYDRYAPLPQSRHQSQVEFAEAKETILSAFQTFDPQFRDIATDFFDKKWVDAAPRTGKRGGAFCAGITPKQHPYILLNYTGNTRDVMTLAHELGHGIHDTLANKQNLLNYHPVLPLAETASTFAELLVFERLLKGLPDAASKLSLVAEHLESLFATVFRQAAMYRFEKRVFRQRQEQGELTNQQISVIWQECIQEMFGTSVLMGEEHLITWSYVPHFINTPFYVYAYSFAELLVLALYARYRKEGDPFREKYKELLSQGGSLAPMEMLSRLDIDITKAEFWQSGCDLIAEEIEEAEFLANDMNYGDHDDSRAPNGGWGEGDDDGWDGYDDMDSDEYDRADWDEEDEEEEE